ARVGDEPDTGRVDADGPGSEHAHVSERRRARGVPSDVPLGRISGPYRELAADPELPHGGLREVRAAPEGHAGRRRLAARSCNHPVRQQHGEQRREQPRPVAAGADRQGRRHPRRQAPEVSAGHAAREHPRDDPRARGRSRVRVRDVRRQHRTAVGGVSMRRTRFRPVASLALIALLAAGGSAGAPKATDVNHRFPDGSTPLQWAVYELDVAEVRRLLDAGADVSAANDYGATPMGLAAEVGHAEILKLLLDAGADPDSPNPEGMTALMAVARTGNVDAARLLLERGATVDARETWGGQTALMWASARRHPQMMELLIAHGADVDARSIHRDYQRRVTAEGRPKSLDSGGFTPLLYAARENCIACVDVLLAKGADIDLPDPDGVTP